MNVKLLAAMGGCAVIAAALMVSATPDPGRVVAGSGNGAVNTFQQPTPTVMTTGATATAGPAASTLATSAASPTAKASPLPAECSMAGQCP
jgi:hypothetical protein